ncbi:cell division protein ZipA C-terminal FtsZ-binding domain-containing protein [Leptothrix discophora]|uniref:Cell division protein ZipA n=1 Tax=Leptothrix discophora TaxID=89 RepID=A0ABT9FYG2_LEPDI|nr:cell division protein ZipA C-terminal FtsZ-binding domain-containing protein [Leptothrix discophora]MDP4299274.1 cell division protein ZipA C-terminal FtsZ-binding domain-containing protein [Leptothrix discophora]
MNSLQFWLGLVGAGVIVALVVHYLVQARRTSATGLRWPETGPAPAPAARVAQEPTFGDAVPGRRQAREPSFDDVGAAGAQAPAPAAGAGAGAGVAAAFAAAAPDIDLPVLDQEIPGAAAPAASARIEPVIGLPLPRRHAYVPRIDALIDGIASLGFEGRLSGETLLQHLPTTRRAGGKPFLIEARDVASGEWESPRLNAWYDEVQAGVQLANRLGPINEIEYSEFVQKIQAFADAIGAMPDFPDMLDVVARGRELDAFASGHDAQLAMRLQARKAAWPIGWVAQHAARHGFVAGATAGRLVLPSAEEGAPPMLALQFDAQAAMADNARDAQVAEITLMFDVPQTPAGDEPYNAWCAAGQALAIALDAQVSDDQGQPLNPAAFPQIGADLAQLYAELAERDLAAGSLAARRLFS